jgi:Sec-independent protein translocase protein TatA
MKFFNLGAGELLLIFIIAVLAIGPKEALRLLGQARDIVQSVRGAMSELTSEISRVAAEVTDIPKKD